VWVEVFLLFSALRDNEKRFCEAIAEQNFFRWHEAQTKKKPKLTEKKISHRRKKIAKNFSPRPNFFQIGGTGVPPYKNKKPKNLCFEGFLHLVDVSNHKKKRSNRQILRHFVPFLSHFCQNRKIIKKHLFARPQPHKTNNKQRRGCQCKKTSATTKQATNKKNPPFRADQKPEKKSRKIVKQLPKLKVNVFLSQKFREKETKTANAPTKPIHIFVFNAYKSIIAYLKEKIKRERGGARFARPLLVCGGDTPPHPPSRERGKKRERKKKEEREKSEKENWRQSEATANFF